ncbi:MAG: VIT and VWA domain-containing protein [Candidatus Eremiobacteraeota bacterium]|nr:VIT and VWA domain-containing protein [Candidatus Eremiobacteraeota bacterium]
MNRREIISILTVVFICLFLTSTAFADGMIIPRPIPGEPIPPYLTIKYHRVKVTINNQVATTEVDQVFINELNRDLEGEYIFPLPEDAALSSFEMEVDGKMVKGKVLDKDKARAIYEEIVRKRKDPALLEYIGRNMVRARIYPIPARGSKRIKLRYSETLKADNGLVKYVYPLDTERFSPKPLKEVTVTVKIDSKIPVKAFYSPSHKMSFKRINDHKVKGSFEKTNFTPEKDLILYYTLSKKDFGLNMMTYKEKGEKEGYFLMFIAPREKTKKTDILPKDVVFVLDKSGSMDEKGKMENAKKALKFCLSNLNREDNFNIIAFSDEIESFSKGGLIPASKNKVKKARDFADDISPIGGTNIEEAIKRGLKSFENGKNARYLIFITDGLPTVGITEPEKIQKSVKENNKNRTRIFTFGVGYDVNTHLLDAIAEENRGYPEYLKPGEEMEIKISSFYRKISNPLLSDVELKIPGIKVTSLYPRELPDIFKGTQLIVTGKYTGSGPSVIKLIGKRGKVAYNNTYEGNFPKVMEKNDFIPRLWAVRRIGYLLSAIRQKGEIKELVNEVIKLASRYGIITPYTSFLVEEPRDEKYRNGKTPAPVGASRPAKTGIFSNSAKEESGEDAVQASTQIAGYKRSNALAADSEKVKHVKGKTFFLRNGFWTDSEYKGNEKITKIKFGSKEYFKLVKDSKLAKYFSLGEKVLVKYKGKAYQVNP